MRTSSYGWLPAALVLAGLTFSGHPSAADAKSGGKAATTSGQKNSEKPPPTTTSPEKKLGPAPDKATNAKVNSYIEILNQESEKFNGIREEWLTKLDPKKGPTCKEDIALVQTLAADAGRLEMYRKYVKAKPKLAPDDAVLRMVDGLEDLQKIGGEGGPYTEYQGRSQPGVWCIRSRPQARKHGPT